MTETPRFIQGVYGFHGSGLKEPRPLTPAASYRVPFDKRAQLIYLRAGNSTDEMVYLALFRGKKPFRYFPIAAKGAVHVQLAIVEDIDPESELELMVGAPAGLEGAVMVDLGLLEI
ncbi:MAG TPA: molybdopterin oxidoreductase [Polyangiaceae bacterium]|nr:molybdopterin oxidoreductase [Polyangiaceae bacterium]